MEKKGSVTLNKDKTNGENLPSSLTFEVLFYLLCLALFTIPPLFFLEIKQDEWISGFIPIQMVNAELKFCVVVIVGSMVTGLIWIRIHLIASVSPYPKSLILFSGIFILAVLLSSCTAHNPTRAWVSSFMWHLLPLALSLSLFQLQWKSKRIILCFGSILIGGLISSLVVMDQHYQWTDWSHRLIRLGYGGLIYNQNFAAEYHAPILPLVMGLFFFVKSKFFKGFLLCSMAFVFMPALALSLARGAWVGLIGGSFITCLIFCIIIFLKKKDLGPKKHSFWVGGSFLILALTLPLYLFTSNYWKKGALTKDRINSEKPTSIETKEILSVATISEPSTGSGRRVVLWKDALLATLSKDFLFGLGTDHYELHFHETAQHSDKTTGGTLVRFVHNDFIQILYENGIIGLIGFLGLWIVVIFKSFFRAFECAKENNVPRLGLILGITASCLTFLIESFFEFPNRSPCSMVVGWTSLGLLIVVVYQKSPENSSNKVKQIGSKFNLFIAAAAFSIITYGCILANNLFWSNIYHFQGRIAGDYGEKDKSLKFHRKSIAYAPWEHHSRKWEAFYLLTHKKNYPEALDAINQTLEVHPGCLVAHQNKVAIAINEFGDHNMARQAYREMKKAAPFHPFTKQEGKKIALLRP